MYDTNEPWCQKKEMLQSWKQLHAPIQRLYQRHLKSVLEHYSLYMHVYVVACYRL